MSTPAPVDPVPVDPAPPAAPGLSLPPTIGVDPGQTWTAAVLRVQDTAVHGWTMGPTDMAGTIRRDALNDVDAWEAFARYADRLVAGLDELAEFARREWGEVRVGVETPKVPIGWQPGSHPKFQRLPLRDWCIPRQVAAVELGAFPRARVVLPDHLGRRPAREYPAELRGTRPPEWGVCEARNGERDHERAAYDIAGLAMTQPR